VIVREHDDPGVFLDLTRDELERREALNGLVLGIATRLRERAAAGEPADEPRPLWVTVESDDVLRLAGVMTPPRPLILATTGGHAGEAVEALVRHLVTRERNVPGVTGPSEVSLEFAESWRRATAAEFRTQMRQGVYELREVRCRGDAPGRMRPASSADVDLLTRWMIAFGRDAGVDAGEDEAAVRELVHTRTARGDFVIWEDGDRPVCTAARARPTRRGATVNAVYTPVEFRRRGYATACVAALSRQILDSGKEFCTLFTDLANPTSNRIYQEIGYERRGSFCEYVFVS
jgi:predicted GNAT family acetyltransferase